MPNSTCRVIFVNRVFAPDRAATSRLLTDLSAHLAEQMPVTVVCSRTTRASDELANLSIYRAPFGRAQGVGLLRRLLADLLFVGFVIGYLLLRARRDDVVVVKTDPPLIQIFVAACALLCRFRYICWHQDLYPEVAVRLGFIRENSLVNRALTAMRDWAIRRAWKNVVIGEQMADYLATTTHCITIPNWAINDRGSADCSAEDLAQYRSLRSENSLLIGHCGNLGRAHPIAPLLNLAHEFTASTGPDFLIGGGGFHYDRLRDEIRAQPAWTFLPFQPEERVPALLAAIDIHLVILDTRLSSFIVPSKCVGVLAAGRPMIFIGDPQSAIAKQLVDAGAAIAVAVDDSQGLIDALRRLCAEEALRSRMADAARQLYDEKFSRASCMRRWSQLIETACAAPIEAHRGLSS